MESFQEEISKICLIQTTSKMLANKILKDLLITSIKMIKEELIYLDSLEYLSHLRENLSQNNRVMKRSTKKGNLHTKI
jgi:hypothetical protein